ncbi:HAMP domain-containing histidine kinase [Haloechinothrix sp. YIM 98757]|uniref:histidine kinase n=1 Tax=Haloechinothrix aidingensis TaxID=2752311 RepID=A0A837ZZ82_9PSEU|nr:HAMP domain-containing sensor histidine kinase [Haloechinothrix aidingensis]MBA0125544.1 HAMP domain-containing histidine kinase [Haloechinothrix aidingensis]
MTEPGQAADGVPAEDRKRRWSLRARVATLAALCVAVAVALVSLGAYMTVRGSLYDKVDEALVARASSVLNDRNVIETGGAKIPGYLFRLADVQFDLVDARGESLLRHPVGGPPVGSPETRVAAGTASRSIRTDDDSDMRVLSVPYEYADGVALVVAQSLEDTRRSLGALAVVLFVVSGAGIVVAALAGTAVARGGLRPVERLTAATERVANTGDLRPIPVSGDDELARLTHSFNTMLAAVADAQQRQRRLVADAGHELRTPLTSLRTNLELLLAAGKADAPDLSSEDQREVENDIRAQLDELTQLIGDLSLLAGADNPHARQERVDLVEVVERALERARRRAGDVRFDVALQPWVLTGDPNVLERAVLNLLDNAVKFSPEQGVVRVRLFAGDDGGAVLEVADAGPGIAVSDLPKVFDRFYRSSEARTLPGSGLGLAIVHQAVQRHGGSVIAGRAPEGGALFTVRLPGSPQ